MNNPGRHAFTDLAITVAGTEVSVIDELEGMLSFTFDLRFAYGSGGTSGKAYLQTSLDEGQTWVDIACVTFVQTTKQVLLNFSGLTPKTTQVVPSDGALTDDTAVDGLIGDRLRLKVVSVGTYAGTTLRARICAR